MTQSGFKGMSLFTDAGERKYLTSAERARFYAALPVLQDLQERSFCETLYWTGCRPSEALNLRAIQVDTEEACIIFCSAKKRGELKGRHFRPIPVPSGFMVRLDQAHKLQQAQTAPDGGKSHALWCFSRTTAWKRLKVVMQAAKLTGIKASAKGLRHGYGVHAAMSKVPETRIKKWLGHESLSTTEIYLDVVGAEDRILAARMWGQDVK